MVAIISLSVSLSDSLSLSLSLYLFLFHSLFLQLLYQQCLGLLLCIPHPNLPHPHFQHCDVFASCPDNYKAPAWQEKVEGQQGKI